MTQIRAAFDIGSSQHKLTVAQCSPQSQPRILHHAAIRVPLADSLTPQHSLPPYILSASHAALRSLKAAAISHGATHFAAIATHVFRVSENGPQHIASLSSTHNISITTLNSTEEGLLAFSTISLYPLDVSTAVVWDSGGASTQLTHRHFHQYVVHSLPLGSSAVRAAYKRLNSIPKLVEWLSSFITHPSDPRLTQKMTSQTVLAIGGPTSMFALAQSRLPTQSFTEEQVRRLFPVVQKEPRQYVLSVLPKLVLLAELMKAYSISVVRHIPSNGNCVGLLLSQDPRFWQHRNRPEDACSTPDEIPIPQRQSASC